ncbi:MAG: response regulator [Gemmatimonadetes bacterium]|nr:response regulator [Gemmatimonadota bacterium]
MPRYRILFIDDEPAILKSLGDYFERLGYDVFRAETGTGGLAAFERVKPDVTVLDLKLPDMSGIEVLGQLRKQHATVLMLTGYGEVENAVEAMRLGAENFLTKPVDLTHLAATVEKAAEKTQLRRENVELRRKLAPSVRRTILRWTVVTALLGASVWLGSLIGGGEQELRPARPIPVPIDSAPRP